MTRFLIAILLLIGFGNELFGQQVGPPAVLAVLLEGNGEQAAVLRQGYLALAEKESVNWYAARLGEEMNRLQNLRTIPSKAGDTPEDQLKQRLLAKLERLQKELHKRMSDLDRFFGLLAEGSVLLKKLGEDAKPLLACIREIVLIAVIAQAGAEGLGLCPDHRFSRLAA